MDEDDDKTALQLTQELLDDLDGFIVEVEQKSAVYDDHLDYLKSGAMPYPVDFDTPVKVEDAVLLPELGGHWAVNPEFSVPSQTHAVKTLRKAISDGLLAVEKPNTKNQFLTRKMIQEWRESCRDQSNRPDFSSVKNVETKTAKSHIYRNGASTTEEKKLIQDAARASLNALKKL